MCCLACNIIPEILETNTVIIPSSVIDQELAIERKRTTTRSIGYKQATASRLTTLSPDREAERGNGNRPHIDREWTGNVVKRFYCAQLDIIQTTTTLGRFSSKTRNVMPSTLWWPLPEPLQYPPSRRFVSARIWIFQVPRLCSPCPISCWRSIKRR